MIGGSADLNPSTNTELKGKGNFQSETRLREFPDSADKKVQGAASGGWGLRRREHRLAACGNMQWVQDIKRNGASWRLDPFAGTFLIFSDYMRPAIRLAALMKLHVIYVFTHDSIALGEDGPTHQPEQLASLRAMPNLYSYQAV